MAGERVGGSGERILVTGAAGQVASSLVERGGQSHHAICAMGRPQLDLTDPATVVAAAEAVRPTVIVNAAAYTAVDKAEEEEAAAFAVNADGVAALARLAAERSIPLVHISTDYVFDGRLDRPWREDDPTNPESAYGRSKRAGEEAVRDAGGPALVCRTAWVYGPFGGNFVKTMLRVGATRDRLTVVDDQYGNPTASLDIADAILALVDACGRLGWPAPDDQILHLAGTGETSWCGLARHVFAVSGELGGPVAEVEPIPTSAWPTPARRPANSRLDTARLSSRYGIALPDWRDSVRATVARLLAEGFPVT